MVLHLNLALKAYPFAGVPCIEGVGPFASPGGLTCSIQLLHLDQASVEDFISYLTDGHACSLEMIKG